MRTRSSAGSAENAAVRRIANSECSRESQIFSNSNSGSGRPVTAGSGSASAIARATPISAAAGHPSPAVANVSQIASSACCCATVNFILVISTVQAAQSTSTAQTTCAKNANHTRKKSVGARHAVPVDATAQNLKCKWKVAHAKKSGEAGQVEPRDGADTTQVIE